jgi:hypothetical protein
MGRRRDWTMEDDERIRELTAAGLCRHAIAVRLGCADATVAKRAHAIDLPLDIKNTGGRSHRPKRIAVETESQSVLDVASVS